MALNPPKGAVVKSNGAERLGESNLRGWQGVSNGVERKQTIEEVSRSCYLQSKATKYDRK